MTTLLLVGALLAGPGFVALSGQHSLAHNWRDAERGSAGIAPRPEQGQEAVVQVYGARAYHWRGYFAIHTWVVTKEAGAARYLVHDVTGWGSRTVRSRPGEPDRYWYGSTPALIADLRGPEAERAIPDILDAVGRYPFADRYNAWPGPNSNTFTAWVIREVPGLSVALPGTAIGKDYLGRSLLARAPSDTGYQFSVFGVLGGLVGLREGLELNLLGLTLGLDPGSLAIKLPGIGHLGLRDPWVNASSLPTVSAATE